MKHTLHTLLLLFLFSLPGVAQRGVTLKGRVTTSDGQPAELVSVGLKGTSVGTSTNASGNFQLVRVKPGSYVLVVNAIGLKSQEMSIEVGSQDLNNLDFVLQEDAAQLQEVLVAANRNTYKVEAPSSTLRSTTPLIETPQNIQVITSELVQDQQVFDMLEGVSRNVSGVTKLEHWDNYARLNMRGARIAPFRNGMNVQSTWGPLAEDMSMVERIEFVKGPAGFMMSNGEPSGFYNVVTKKPTGITKGAASFTVGSYDTYRATTDLDGKLTQDGKLLYRLNLMAQNKGSHRPHEYNNRYTIAPVLKYQLDDRTSLTLEYTYQYAQMSVLGANYVFSPNRYADLPVDYSTTNASLDPTVVHDHSTFAILEHQLNPNWKITGQLAYFNSQQEGSSLWPASVYNPDWTIKTPALDAAGNLQRGVSIWDAANVGKFGQFFVNGEVTTGFITHRLLGGLDLGTKEYLADWGQSFMLGGVYNIYTDLVPATVELPTFNRSKSLRQRAGSNILDQTFTGIYVQDELGFFENRVRLTLAGRYTSVEESSYGTVAKADKFSPRIGLSGSITDQTSVYALYDQAFVPQSANTIDNKNVGPITGNNLEVGFKRDWNNGRWNTTLSAYRITKNNQAQAAGTTAQGVTYYAALGQTRTQGVELDVRGELLPNLNLTVNYAYTNSEITKDAVAENVGDAVPGATKHIQNAWLAYRMPENLLKGLGLSLGYQWQVDRSSWFVFDGTESSLPDYFRLDGALSWQSDKFSVGLNVNNLLDKYLYSGGPMDLGAPARSYYWQSEAPRNYRFTVGYRF
ncbi:TonB-dependent receptor [Rufibacter quisquiliarum]|uniref:Iron complex outermembrane receptor protein n=1 Tax=Rufibacter quisquiliarum TaxID=1549639 RepID=A0A839GM50_9BACT|nr:TonB-dependent receptor [Rufibacter quisquiliarum]MBA9079790.1 iron complex outermembrane receptor protein [Rufibacter quisquiliarum]